MVKTDVPPYEEWTVAELKDELAARELQVGGVKDELVARLAEHDAAAAKPAKAEKVRDPSVCVVDDGSPHVGKAGGVNGAVCSRHAMHYDRTGRRRG